MNIQEHLVLDGVSRIIVQTRKIGHRFEDYVKKSETLVEQSTTGGIASSTDSTDCECDSGQAQEAP